jgi:predicted HicB family RNase H-like nuclease
MSEPLTTRISEETARRLRVQAALGRTSIAAIVEQALQEFLASLEVARAMLNRDV